MNAMTKREEDEILTARIRALQAIYQVEHQALMNWGLWSLDKSGIGPGEIEPQPVFAQFTGDTEGYELAQDSLGVVISVAAPRDDPPRYDEKSAIALDERIHGFGGLPEYVRLVLKTAYVSRSVPEYQFARFSNCSTWDQFCERLETALRFVSRFA